jgi:hypothetical protein
MVLEDQHRYWLLVDLFSTLETLRIISKRPQLTIDYLHPNGQVKMGFRHR